ncbi:MAG: enolase C-terminal domain-like protein, partial [Hyphomicrobiaceae bacterium]
MRNLETTLERWPIAGTFVISRGARRHAETILTTISDGTHTGRSECVPYGRYGETVEGVQAAILLQRDAIAEGATRAEIAGMMSPGAALNAVDCALWDLEAKASGRSVADLTGQPLAPVTTAYTLSLGSPESMAKAAGDAGNYPLLKLKLGGDGDPDRLRAVRAARPDARLIADANEAWDTACIEDYLSVAAEVGVEVVEQPLPANADEVLEGMSRPVPVCADESAHHAGQIADIARRY